MINKSYHISSEAEMLALGKRLSQYLKNGSFVALNGEMGSGKSVFARGIGNGLGIESLSSPTFSIVHEYPTTPPLFHFDVYRIQDEFELEGIGFSDYLNRNGIIIMEWAELVPDVLPAERLEVSIKRADDRCRLVSVFSYGDKYDETVRKL